MEVEKIAEKLNITIDKAKEIKGIVKGEINPLTYSNVEKWVNQCYNMPSKLELKLEAINQVLEGFGVEYIEHIDDTCTNPCGLSYINLGDTYTCTVVYDHAICKFFYMDYGTAMEKSPEAYI